MQKIKLHVTAWLLLLSLAMTQLNIAWAQQSSAPASGSTSSSLSITWKICEPPPLCFRSAEDRKKWAADNKCQFLEDVCDKASSSADNKGAMPEDQSFWGQLWDNVATGLKYGYEFGKGLFEGLKSQVADLIELISNPLEVVQGLIELGKAFYNDPKGTLKILGELLGQEASDTVARATQCGAYDLGKVIGSYVSPAVALKLASKLTKYGGKLADAVKATKADLGCASFVAGTPVLTPQGMQAIERIGKESWVHSRDDEHWSDAPQAVQEIFTRVAPSYRVLRTERETFQLTDEHPLWVQGKGWTKALEVTDEDVLASLTGDVLVKSNELIQKPIKVYNFSVAKTPNYFVGNSGLWAHNAKCALPMPYKAPKSPSGYKVGASDGGNGKFVEINRPDSPAFQYEKQVTGNPKNIEYEVSGKKFDGYDSSRKVLLDAKDYTKDNPIVTGQPPFLAEKFRADALVDAKDQVAKAGGTKVEWHVSSKEAAAELEKLFTSDPSLKGNISVLWTPDIVN